MGEYKNVYAMMMDEEHKPDLATDEENEVSKMLKINSLKNV